MKLGSLSLTIRNKKFGQSMHALTKTKVSEASLTNLHKVWVALGQNFQLCRQKKKNTENLKPQPESKLLLSTIRVALSEKNMSVMTLCIT